jgi:release factor glutamine methyltransferase
VTVLQSSWFSALEKRFAMIVSNPPYIDEHDPHLAQGDVRFEPLTALVAANGLADLDHIVNVTTTFASRRLAAGTWLDAGRSGTRAVYASGYTAVKPAATTAATNA